MQTQILASSMHVVCVVHHSGGAMYTNIKPLIQTLAQQNRVTLLVLGEHIKRSAQADVFDWAEQEMSAAWANLPIESLSPVS